MSWDDKLIPDDQRDLFHRIGTELCFCSDRLDREQLKIPPPKEATHQSEDLHSSEKEILSPLFDQEFELIGTGLARCVFRFPSGSNRSDYVLKLSRFGIDPLSLGASQNKREVMLWKRYGEGGQWPLLPVEDFHVDRLKWLVMPYGEPLEEVNDNKQKELLRQVRGDLKFLPDFDIREVRKENVVIIDGSPYLADYGLPDGC